MAGEPDVLAGQPIDPSQLRALFDAIETRFGRQVASEIWYQVFGGHDGAAQT